MAEDTDTPTSTDAEKAKPGPEETKAAPLPELDFSTFILSLSSSVLINLGLLENPVTQKAEKDLAVAKQTIDLIVLLKDKTSGNLTESESKLIEDLLTELQLQYCKAIEG
ncbi:MAG: DUF1844 domain-containing protein [Thermodesulfobacteriota bacterium]